MQQKGCSCWWSVAVLAAGHDQLLSSLRTPSPTSPTGEGATTKANTSGAGAGAICKPKAESNGMGGVVVGFRAPRAEQCKYCMLPHKPARMLKSRSKAAGFRLGKAAGCDRPRGRARLQGRAKLSTLPSTLHPTHGPLTRLCGRKRGKAARQAAEHALGGLWHRGGRRAPRGSGRHGHGRRLWLRVACLLQTAACMMDMRGGHGGVTEGAQPHAEQAAGERNRRDCAKGCRPLPSFAAAATAGTSRPCFGTGSAFPAP